MTPTSDIAARVRTEQLPNGVQLYLLENHANTTVDIVGLIEGGTLIEQPAESGLANLTVGMLDRGTRQRDHLEIAQALEASGALLHYGLTPEAVVVRGRCLTEDLALLIELLGETLREPSFPEDQLELVREDALVGLREAVFDTRDRAQRRAAELLLGEDHPYARHPLGREEVVQSLHSSDLRRLHQRVACGRALSLAIVGDIAPERVRDLVGRHFGELAAGRPVEEEPAVPACSPGSTAAGAPAAEPVHVEIPDKGQIDLVFMRPGVARRHPEFEAYGLANFILGGSFVSRLNLQLRDREGLTYGAHSVILSGRQPGVWYASIGVAPRNVARATAGVLREMKRLADEGVADEELTMARQHLTGSFPIKLETNRAVAGVLLDSVRSERGLDYVDRYLERIQAIPSEQVDAAARELFASDDIVTVTAGTRGG